MDYEVVTPPEKYCTDNGAMIAWNGVEKWKIGVDIVPPVKFDSVIFQPK